MIQQYINQNYKQDIRLGVVSQMAGMSPVAFSRFFKTRTGKSLSEYIIDVRLGYAANLLIDTNNTVADICYDCGFNNKSNFIRIFTKRKNMTPIEYRNHISQILIKY